MSPGGEELSGRYSTREWYFLGEKGLVVLKKTWYARGIQAVRQMHVQSDREVRHDGKSKGLFCCY